jgi:putative salt-induced outer membrane protein YdiY
VVNAGEAPQVFIKIRCRATPSFTLHHLPFTVSLWSLGNYILKIKKRKNMKISNKILIGLCSVSIVASAAFAQEEEVEAKDWDLSVNLGANFSGGNTESYLVNAGAEYNLKLGVSDIKAGFNLNYGEVEQTDEDGNKETVKDVDKYNIYGAYTYNFSERYFADVIAAMMHDYKADIKHRYRIGPSFGANLINNDEFVLSTSGGAVYFQEEYENDSGTDEYVALRFAENFTWTIQEGTKLVQGIEYMPEVDDFDNYLMNFSLSLEAPIAKGTSMFVTFIDTYDNTPVDDKEKNDTSLVFGLQYSL